MSPAEITKLHELAPNERTAARTHPGFQLMPADMEMIRKVYEYRFLHVDHVSALTDRSYKKVHGRLYKLVRNQFLARIELPFQKHIYVIGREGITILVEQGIAPRELIETRLRHCELKELFLKHQMMLVDLHCIVELACRGTSIRLVTWREDRELWDRVAVWIDRERMNLPVCPDALLTLEDSSRQEGRNRLNFFVEADRSTSTHKRFEQKLIAYWQYLESGLHTEKFKIKTLRVVTFTLTEKRALGLCAAARKALPVAAWKYFLFASVEGVTIADAGPILSEMFVTPREGRVRLVPAN